LEIEREYRQYVGEGEGGGEDGDTLSAHILYGAVLLNILTPPYLERSSAFRCVTIFSLPYIMAVAAEWLEHELHDQEVMDSTLNLVIHTKRPEENGTFYRLAWCSAYLNGDMGEDVNPSKNSNLKRDMLHAM